MNDLNYPADVEEQIEMLGEFTVEGNVTISPDTATVTTDTATWNPDIPWSYT